MIELLFDPANLAFSLSLAVMFGIAAVEGATTLLGAALSSVVESALPHLDLDLDLDIDLDAAAGADVDGPTGSIAHVGDAHGSGHAVSGHGPLVSVLGWLRVGQLPVLILLIVFLTTFGLAGLGVQSLAHGLLGSFLPASVAWLPALGLSAPIFRLASGVTARFMPKDETSAVSHDTFVGCVGVVTIGTARAGHPAEVRVRDTFGKSHYVMVEPEEIGEEIHAGEPVLLVRRAGSRFHGICPPAEAVIPEDIALASEIRAPRRSDSRRSVDL